MCCLFFSKEVKENSNLQLNELNIKSDVIMSLHIKELSYIDCTCKNGLIASYRFNTYLHLKHIHVCSNEVLVLFMNKVHAIDLDIDGLCRILLRVQIFITPIKSLNSNIAQYFVILTKNLIWLRRWQNYATIEISDIYLSILSILF